jgi:fatty-acyl-CoA synthase
MLSLVPDRKVKLFSVHTLKGGTNATEEEIREFCDGKIAHFNPQYIRFVDAFPMTATRRFSSHTRS